MNSTPQIDYKIVNTCQLIDDNIRLGNDNRQLISQNVIQCLRHLAEYVALKIYSSDDNCEYKNIREAIKYLKCENKHTWLHKFHCYTQNAVSHSVQDPNNASRLMLKYYEFLLKIKIFLKDNYQMEILYQLNNFPITYDPDSKKFYEKIVEKINTPLLTQPNKYKDRYKDRYYIQSVTPFFIESKVYYQIQFNIASDHTSKSDRIIAFTRLDILSYYAVKFNIRTEEIEVFNGIKVPIQIIDGYDISIRYCEMKNFAKIFGIDIEYKGTKEHEGLMRHLNDNDNPNSNLIDLIDTSDRQYEQIRQKILQNYTPIVFSVLDKCRELIASKKIGSNVVRYLLFTMNNKIIKQQYQRGMSQIFPNLYIKNGCNPFDKMPFCTSLVGHNPKIFDLIECLDTTDRQHEFLARFIKHNTEINGNLYTAETDLKKIDNLDKLIDTYNSELFSSHLPIRKLERYSDQIYLLGYQTDVIKIIKRLEQLAQSGVNNYKNSIEIYLKNYPNMIDCEQKQDMFKEAFENSKVAAIYGAAGTGKTTFIKYIAEYFSEATKYFLANTNAAVQNLKRRISVKKSTFMTIERYKNKKSNIENLTLLVIDECSTVSNADMQSILEKNNFLLLVLVGDIFQIESIQFGNWFDIAKKALPDSSIFELTTPYRTNNKKLLDFWQKVRGLDPTNNVVAECIANNNFASSLNEEIFQNSAEEDSAKEEIILCLNYSGLYGVNNINNFLQIKNQNSAIQWGVKNYKIGDPILFNEFNRFSPLIHNNCKGVINKIEVSQEEIFFEITLNIAINEIDAMNYNFNLLAESSSDNSIIRFSVIKQKNTDDDNDSQFDQVPFHVAYAVSIHKAQGLEYDSVKVVIADDIEEQITHNIFYTAITRAKKDLKIYWSESTQQKILSRIKPRNNSKDYHLLSNFLQEDVKTE